jgi:hypothetical protein
LGDQPFKQLTGGQVERCVIVQLRIVGILIPRLY